MVIEAINLWDLVCFIKAVEYESWTWTRNVNNKYILLMK